MIRRHFTAAADLVGSWLDRLRPLSAEEKIWAPKMLELADSFVELEKAAFKVVSDERLKRELERQSSERFALEDFEEWNAASRERMDAFIELADPEWKLMRDQYLNEANQLNEAFNRAVHDHHGEKWNRLMRRSGAMARIETALAGSAHEP